MTDEETTTDLAKRPQPVTPELRARVRALHGEGLGRNAIAREVQVSGATVTKIAKQFKPPLEFNREETAIALRARQIDLGSIRESLARKFLLAADDSLNMLAAPVVLGQFGGKDNTWNETLLPEPTIEQRKTLIGSAQAAAKSGVDLLAVDAANGSVSARGMVVELAEALAKGLAVMSAEGIEVDPTVTPDQPAGT